MLTAYGKLLTTEFETWNLEFYILKRLSQTIVKYSHILPKGFIRIRHYGLLYTTRRKELRQLQNYFGLKTPEQKVKKDWKQLCQEYLGYDPDICPSCGKAEMVIIERWLPGRAPPIQVLNPQVVKVK